MTNDVPEPWASLGPLLSRPLLTQDQATRREAGCVLREQWGKQGLLGRAPAGCVCLWGTSLYTGTPLVHHMVRFLRQAFPRGTPGVARFCL